MQTTREMTTQEVIDRGKAIYDNRLREQVETPENIGQVLVIDIASGDYEMAHDHLTALNRLRERHPEGRRFAMRIGYPTLGRRGGYTVAVNR